MSKWFNHEIYNNQSASTGLTSVESEDFSSPDVTFDSALSSRSCSPAPSSYTQKYDNSQNSGGKSRMRMKLHSDQFSKAQPMRQLPCRTFLSCGSCSYGVHCVFLHDIRLKGVDLPYHLAPPARRVREKIMAADGLFWPTMSVNSLEMDENGRPRIDQEYQPIYIAKNDNSVARPPPSCNSKRAMHAVFSAWGHFIDFLSTLEQDDDVNWCSNVLSSMEDENAYTSRPRLPVFVQLANSHICEDEKNGDETAVFSQDKENDNNKDGKDKVKQRH